MKLTHKLFHEVSKKYRPKYEFHTREEWKNRGRRMNFPRAYIPPEVQETIKLPPEEMLISQRYVDEIKRNTVVGYEEFLKWQRPDLVKLLIKENPIELVERPDAYMFNQYNRFEYGDTQSSLITKTKIIKTKLPHQPIVLPDNVGQILERFILKANWWITDEDKFPKRFNPDLRLFQYKAEYGISIKKRIRYLLKDLFEYCEHISDSNEFRLISKDHIIETFYTWNNRRIQFVESRDFLISGSEPLGVFATEPISWNPDCNLKHLGPVDPCIDLKIKNHYPLASCDGWTTSDVIYKYPHLITVNLDLPNIHTDFLEPEGRQINQSQKNAIGIMNCFAQCVSTARRVFGDDAVDQCQNRLPHPICVHAICFDGVQFDFISYQLNSTDFSNDEYANLVWIDSNNKFFSKACHSKGMLRNTRYENLNIDVFRKLMQYFQYGLKNNT